jgi:hypothetical protein
MPRRRSQSESDNTGECMYVDVSVQPERLPKRDRRRGLLPSSIATVPAPGEHSATFLCELGRSNADIQKVQIDGVT